MILAGDIGGTKTLLALFNDVGRTLELLRYLRSTFTGHVSYEHVLTGPGLHNVYTFLRDSNFAPEPAWLAEECGGIAPKLLPALRSGRFMQAFTAKGRFAELLHRIPVNVALNPRAPLLGAARYALRLVSST